MEIKFEEFKMTSTFWSWLILILLCLSILAWGFANYFLISTPKRDWDYGALPDTPAQSIYSTVEPSKSVNPPRQITPLPEADSSTQSGGGS